MTKKNPILANGAANQLPYTIKPYHRGKIRQVCLCGNKLSISTVAYTHGGSSPKAFWDISLRQNRLRVLRSLSQP